MATISIAMAGFSIVIAALLVLTYVSFLDLPNKSPTSILSCTVLLTALATLQLGHLLHWTGGKEPLDVFHYRLALFVAPVSFYFFGRCVRRVRRCRTSDIRISGHLHRLSTPERTSTR